MKPSPIAAVILDWAGTLADYGSCAPAYAFVELFLSHGIYAPLELIRSHMGTAKREHLKLILCDPSVEERWRQGRGTPPDGSDVDVLYEEFQQIQIRMIGERSALIPGVLETAAFLRARGIKIGTTTGYVRSMMEALVQRARDSGFEPDTIVCADQVPAARPASWMALKAASELAAYPVWRCVKAGDTVADILEGVNAGMWSIGVTRTGNEIGLSEEDVLALPGDELPRRLSNAKSTLESAGADYVIESIAHLPPVLEEIEERLRNGSRPALGAKSVTLP